VAASDSRLSEAITYFLEDLINLSDLMGYIAILMTLILSKLGYSRC